LKIVKWFCEVYGDEDDGTGIMAIEPMKENGLISLGWGFATTIVRPPKPYVIKPGDAGIIASRFVTVLRSWLDSDEWRLMGERNAVETDPFVCHSHDFCDANMAMCEAFASVTGGPPDADDEAQAKLWSTAWADAMPYLTLYTAEWSEKR